MLPILLALTLQTPGIERDSYGVPVIHASTQEGAWRLAGRAVVEDRFWQMEMSRRLARGRLAELLGKDYAASDREVLKTGYTDEELLAQFDRLRPETQAMVRAYVDGVNEFFSNVPAERVPIQGFKPEPWTIVDSMAIGVRLFSLFGRGGAGEIRNMALFGYLQGRANLKGKQLDVFDDFAWQNDPKSPVTVERSDDPVKNPPVIFPAWNQKTSEDHLAKLPKLNLLELLPAVQLSQRVEAEKVAQKLNVPWKVGSYCVVVGRNRSATGYPILLSGPQMGFQNPSIVHETSIHAPGLDVCGIDVPGLPGIAIGATPDLAWGLTSGVADTDDVVFYKSGPNDTYGDGKTLQKIVRTIRIKDLPDEQVVQLRTTDGPVVLNNPRTGFLFARRSSYWQQELSSLDVFTGLYKAKEVSEIREALRPATMSFNFFFATRGGDIGYKYLGRIPLRAHGWDYRFPVPGEVAWTGFMPFEKMPHVVNPRSGLLTNWNNKPVSWWPNGDTPTWGEIFRVSVLRSVLDKPKLNTQDVEMGPWSIARMDETWPYLAPFTQPQNLFIYNRGAFVTNFMPAYPSEQGTLHGFDGRLIDGSIQANTYIHLLSALRTGIFGDDVGNFVSPEYFRLVVQPTVIHHALLRKTRIDYMNGQKANDVVRLAYQEAVETSGRYKANGISVKDEPAIPYSNRGTYIQIVELLPSGSSGRNINLPGVAETGPHAKDQVPLARAWTYKEMRIKP